MCIACAINNNKESGAQIITYKTLPNYWHKGNVQNQYWFSCSVDTAFTASQCNVACMAVSCALHRICSYNLLLLYLHEFLVRVMCMKMRHFVDNWLIHQVLQKLMLTCVCYHCSPSKHFYKRPLALFSMCVSVSEQRMLLPIFLHAGIVILSASHYRLMCHDVVNHILQAHISVCVKTCFQSQPLIVV